MSEEAGLKIFCVDDYFGRCPVGLLESSLSEHARICYAVLTSFGREAFAGREAIRRRMGVRSLTTVKSALRELQGAGWIEKAKDGGGRDSIVWKVYGRPHNGQGTLELGTGAPDAPVTQRPGHSAPRAGHAPHRGIERPLNKNISKKEGVEAHAEEKVWKDLFWSLYRETHGGQDPTPFWTPFLTKRIREITVLLGPEEISRRVKIYFKATGSHALEDFVRNIDRWTAERGQQKGGTNGRGFNQPTGSDWVPSENV